MEPGKTYIKVLPGHSRPVFVRKRRQTFASGFGLTAIAKALGASTSLSRPTQRVEEMAHPQPEPTSQFLGIAAPPIQVGLIHPCMPYANFQVERASQASVKLSQLELERADPQVETTTTQAAKGNSQRQETALRHFCSLCGKHRSPGYHSRHPFRPGDIPSSSTCRRCVQKYTSSEESDCREQSQRNKKVNARRARPLRRQWIGFSDTANIASSSKEQIRITRRVRPTSDESQPRTNSQLSSTGVVQLQSFGLMGADNTYEKKHSEHMRHVIDRPRDFSDTSGAGSSSSSQISNSSQESRSAQPIPGQISHYRPGRTFRSRRVESFQYRDCVAGQKNGVRNLSRSRPSLWRHSKHISTNNGSAAQTDHGYDFQQLDKTDHWRDPSRSNSRLQELEKDHHLEDIPWRPSKSVRVIRVARGIEEPVARMSPEALRSMGKRILLARDQPRLPRSTSGVPYLANGTLFDGTQRYFGRHMVEEAEDSEEHSPSGRRGRNLTRPRSETNMR